MEIQTTTLPGLYLLRPTIFKDERGFFYEAFTKEKFERETGTKVNFVQDNQSRSEYGVIRGLHYQLNPNAQAKLIWVIRGKILDVVVDLRKGSPTYGESFSLELSDENNFQIFVPKGFAHGFSVLSDSADVIYKTDNYYNKNSESGILFNDINLNIDWKIPKEKMIISKKDQLLKPFDQAEHNFQYSFSQAVLH